MPTDSSVLLSPFVHLPFMLHGPPSASRPPRPIEAATVSITRDRDNERSPVSAGFRAHLPGGPASWAWVAQLICLRRLGCFSPSAGSPSSRGITYQRRSRLLLSIDILSLGNLIATKSQIITGFFSPDSSVLPTHVHPTASWASLHVRVIDVQTHHIQKVNS